MKDFNEKCAEYLGWDYFKGFYIRPNTENPNDMLRLEELKFDSDWNWIMLVLEAILEECSEDYHFEPYYEILDFIPNLEQTKQAIYNYITDNENT